MYLKLRTNVSLGSHLRRILSLKERHVQVCSARLLKAPFSQAKGLSILKSCQTRQEYLLSFPYWEVAFIFTVLIRVSPWLGDSAANKPPGRSLRILTSCRLTWYSAHIPDEHAIIGRHVLRAVVCCRRNAEHASQTENLGESKRRWGDMARSSR